MNTELEDIDLIERFLSGNLSHKEAMEIETRLEEDHEFARKLRLRKTFPSLFKAEGQDEIIMDLPETPVESYLTETVRKKGSRRVLWVIAGLLILAVSGFLFIRFLLPVFKSTGHDNVLPASGEKKTTELKTTSQTSAEKKQLKQQGSRPLHRYRLQQLPPLQSPKL